MSTTIAKAVESRAAASSVKVSGKLSRTANGEIGSVRRILYVAYGIVPIAAGADKFLNLLANWELYLNPLVTRILPLSAKSFMSIAGVVEILAGILVFIRPKIGAFVVAAWLTVISLSLLATGRFLDIAVRDLVMAVGAFSLARLSSLEDYAGH